MVATLAPCLISTGPSDTSRPHQPRESESDGAVEQRHYESSAAIRAHGSRSERTIHGGRPRSSSHSSLGPLIIPPPGPPACPEQPALQREPLSVGGDGREPQSHAHTGERGLLGKEARGEEGSSVCYSPA